MNQNLSICVNTMSFEQLLHYLFSQMEQKKGFGAESTIYRDEQIETL